MVLECPVFSNQWKISAHQLFSVLFFPPSEVTLPNLQAPHPFC